MTERRMIMVGVLFCLCALSGAAAQREGAVRNGVAAQGQAVRDTAPYRDLTHYSKVFGQNRWYRLYLPAGYKGAAAGNKGTSRRYPVIYFFHGWGGRHFKDENSKLDYVQLQELVNYSQGILVL